MSNWKTYDDGEKIPYTQYNQYLNYREYDTYAELAVEAAGWSVTEAPRIVFTKDTKRFYYWNGTSLLVFPSVGGSGAPVDASYVTINAEASLDAEIQHKNITDPNLHEPKAHKTSHQNAGSDEIDVTGLSGLLADEQDAGKIKSKAIDALVANRYLFYDGSTMTWASVGGGGDMTKAVYDTNDDGVADNSEKLEASTKAQVQDHTPKTHKDSHKTGGGDAFAVTDLLDGVARTTARKNSGANVGSRRRLNFIEGSNTIITVADDAANEEVDVTIGQSGASGWTFKQLPFSYVIYKDGSDYKALNGATGDIDYTSADASTVIQAVIDTDPTGIVFFKEGEYNLSNDIELQNDTEYHIVGSGYNTRLNRGGANPVFEIADSGNYPFWTQKTTIEDMYLNAPAGYGIKSEFPDEYGEKSPWLALDHMFIQARFGIKINTPYKLDINYLHILAPEESGGPPIGIWLYSEVPGFNSGDSKIEWVMITDNYGDGTGILIDATDVAAATLNLMTFQKVMIYSGYGGVDSKGVHLKANDRSKGYIEYIYFRELDVENAREGVRIEGASSGVGDYGFMREVVVDGGFASAGDAGAGGGTPYGVRAGGDLKAIRFNNMRFADQAVRVDETTTTGEVVFVFDQCVWDVAPVLGTPAQYCRFAYNIGPYAPLSENSGTSTGTGAQQTIAHGLATTPNRIFLSESTTGGALAYQSAAADATNIYVTATNTKTYQWKAEII